MPDVPSQPGLPEGAFAHEAGGLTLQVYVQPRASRSEVVGWQQDALKVRLCAPPVDGRANQACVELLAVFFGVPRRQIEILQGHQGRHKRVRIIADPDVLMDKLAEVKLAL
ncbi:MAG: YggU family protein [Gemmatimonadaceae bacterium]|nr:YggU family protein [Gloeobacterales cyanobacterium ES-bin-141]